MRIKKFRTSNDMFDHSVPLDTGSESKVEKAGYISAKKRIENMMLAGQRLVASRAQMYDDETGELDDIPFDPTRRPGYDMADASQDQLAVQVRLKSQEKAAKDAAKEKAAKIDAEASKKAQEEPKKVKEGGE